MFCQHQLNLNKAQHIRSGGSCHLLKESLHVSEKFFQQLLNKQEFDVNFLNLQYQEESKKRALSTTFYFSLNSITGKIVDIAAPLIPTTYVSFLLDIV